MFIPHFMHLHKYVIMKHQFNLLKRFLNTQKLNHPKVCIVGAGPAGFYAAQRLLKKINKLEVDVYERLPVPFGLVRFGVAPDHPEVKNVINTFTKTAKNPNFKFFGNVNLGQDVTLNQLKNAYHIVLLTYGAEDNRKLNIPGENLKNCIEARKIVGWYNGIPWNSKLDIDLSGEVMVIFGQGNVAIDVARILLTPVEELKKTDITQHALEVLSSSRIKRVHLIGRRGPLQAAFTIKELREMLKLKDCNTIWKKEDFDGIFENVSRLERPRRRITELMLKSLSENKPLDGAKEFYPAFHRSPIEILGKSQLEGVVLGVNRLEGDDLLNKRAVLTEHREIIQCQLAVPCIGYRSIPADNTIPFDAERGMVKSKEFKVDKGLYASGWLATGPKGVILSTMSNAFEVADIIVRDMEKLLEEDKGGSEEILHILISKNVQVVSWENWEHIDRVEQENGAKVGKPREKIVDINKMLQIASC